MTALHELRARHGDRDGADLLLPAIRREFAGRIALVSSFGAESAVLLHMVAQIDPQTPVIFLDTDRLFPQTLEYRDTLVDRLRLADVRTIRPRPADITADSGALHAVDPDLCCRLRKVEPLERALRGFQAWITGRKRAHGGDRARLATIEAADWRIKFNPLAPWSPVQVADYMARHKLPVHPLAPLGFASVGCAPCTAPVARGGDPRSGRWSGRDKSECGIHWTANGKPIRMPTPA